MQGTTAGQRAAEALGAETADEIIREHLNAGMTTGQLAQWHYHHATWLASDARTPAGQAFARGYTAAADGLAAELREMEEPGLVPVPPDTPHPAPAMAAKGWRTCGHEHATPCYVRRNPDADRGTGAE